MFYFEHLCFLFVSAGRIICVNVKYPADDCSQIPHLTAHSRKAAQRLQQPLLQQSMENQHYQSYYCLITRAFYVIQMSWEIKRRSKMIFVFHVLQTGFNGHYEDFCYFHFLLVAQRHWCNYHVVWVTASSFDSVRDWTFAITHLALRQPIQHCDTSILKMHITICRKSPQMTGKSHLDNRIFWGKQKKTKKTIPFIHEYQHKTPQYLSVHGCSVSDGGNVETKLGRLWRNWGAVLLEYESTGITMLQ